MVLLYYYNIYYIHIITYTYISHFVLFYYILFIKKYIIVGVGGSREICPNF